MTADTQARAQAPLGIIAAIPEEMAHLRGDGTDAVEIAGQRFERTRVEGRDAVLVETGIGKVNAAVTATLLAREFGCRALVFSGVAGGLDPDLGVGDVVVADRVVQHDYGAVVDGALRPYQPGNIPLPGFDATHGYDVPATLRQTLHRALDGVSLPQVPAQATGDAPRMPRLVFGTVLTGDAFVNCETTRRRLHGGFAAQAVEMEGGAVAQVAERFGIPWVVVRCLSDLAGATSHMDFGAFLPVAAANAATVVRRIVQAL